MEHGTYICLITFIIIFVFMFLFLFLICLFVLSWNIYFVPLVKRISAAWGGKSFNKSSQHWQWKYCYLFSRKSEWIYHLPFKKSLCWPWRYNYLFKQIMMTADAYIRNVFTVSWQIEVMLKSLLFSFFCDILLVATWWCLYVDSGSKRGCQRLTAFSF